MKMKSNMWAIMRKEFARFFGDKRLVFSTILLPGLMIYVIYSIMGGAIGGMMGGEEGYVPVCYSVDMPEMAEKLLEPVLGCELIEIEQGEKQHFMHMISSGDADLLIEFPENAASLFDGTAVPGNTDVPSISIYYNSASVDSSNVYSAAWSALTAYESSVTNIFDINAAEDQYDLATEEATAGQIFSMMMPMLLMMFMFSGCMAVAPESIAGEKERGTIATLLVTPLRRSELALGKICSLGVIAVLSGVSSTVGTVLALPQLMNLEEAGVTMDASVYGVSDYLMLGVVIISTVLLLVAIISCISAFAKSTKEASTMLTPLMIANMLLGITAMFGSAQQNIGVYFIPLYNSVQCMNGIFSFEPNVLHIAVTCGVNLAVLGVLVFVLTKMFDSEKVMFSK